MGFIGNLSVAKRLFLLTLVSVIGIVFVGFYSILPILKHRDELVLIEKKVTQTKQISRLIHQLQTERGLSAGVIASKGNEEKISLLKTQRKKTDEALSELDKSMLPNFATTLAKHREAVDFLNISLELGTKFYTTTIASLLEDLVKVPSMISDEEVVGLIQSYIYITSSKESLGQTRALLNGAFINNAFSGGAYAQLCVHNGIIECNDHKFTLLAPSNLLEIYKHNQQKEHVKFVKSAINSAISSPDGNFNIQASTWFENVTNMINDYRELEKSFFSELDSLIAQKISKTTSMLFSVLAVLLITTIVVLVLSTAIGKNIARKVKKIELGLDSFFCFLSGKAKHIQPIEDLGKDEFGKIGLAINQNIEDAKHKLLEQQQSIVDIESVCAKSAKGFLFYRASTNYTQEALNKTASSLNALLDTMELVLNNLTAILIDFTQGNYKNASIDTNTQGSFASIQQAMKAISASNSEMFGVIAKFSREFSQDASMLSIAGDDLSTSSNEQASSLEETAAAIEELTSNVAANSAKAQDMTKIAQEAKLASENGNIVARESLNAMSEIVNATKAINQAVSVIENIAFQTNILSLNAAVEAATAGDAGKGFAVVAQEVRNLANRSAEAAKEILELAKIASIKSQGGLETSQNMMESFALISQKITQTDEMVRDVANASREQMAGIGQINDAVSQLDQMTQQNAKTASNVADIANQVLDKTKQFEMILSRIKFDSKYEKQSCDIAMVFDTAKLKIDHINFKENNYKKLKTDTTPWKVTNHHDCNLGKWIDAHSNEKFAQTSQWRELLSIHQKVHDGVQSLIQAEFDNASMQHFDNLSKELERATFGVFDGLDSIKQVACEQH